MLIFSPQIVAQCQALTGRFSSVHITAGFRNDFQDHRQLPVCILRVKIATVVGSLKRVAERFSELVSNFIEASKNFDFVIYISKSS
jgi:hypothetical protein